MVGAARPSRRTVGGDAAGRRHIALSARVAYRAAGPAAAVRAACYAVLPESCYHERTTFLEPPQPLLPAARQCVAGAAGRGRCSPFSRCRSVPRARDQRQAWALLWVPACLLWPSGADPAPARSSRRWLVVGVVAAMLVSICRSWSPRRGVRVADLLVPGHATGRRNVEPTRTRPRHARTVVAGRAPRDRGTDRRFPLAARISAMEERALSSAWRAPSPSPRSWCRAPTGRTTTRTWRRPRPTSPASAAPHSGR